MVPELPQEAIGKSKAILTHFFWTKNYVGFIHLKWLPIFEFPKIWKIALRIFQIFEKPFSNFEFCFEKYVKQYLDAYIFWGNSTSHSQLISIYHQFINRNARFPQKSQASNIDLQWSNSIIGKFEDGSSKISKIGRRIFQIFEYSKNSKKKQMNDASVFKSVPNLCLHML